MSDPVRYRCTACGNLTRFDVVSTRRTRSFHHYTVGGELEIENTEVLSEVVEDAACRWCGTGASVVEVDPGEVNMAADGAAEVTSDGRAPNERGID